MRTPLNTAMSSYRSLVLCVLLSAGLVTSAEELPRRAYFGLTLENAESGRGVFVSKVDGGSPAAMAGIEAGNVIQKIGTVQLLGADAAEHATRSLAAQTPGEAVLLTVTREGLAMHLVIIAESLPKEESNDFDILYGEVVFEGRQLRTIVTKPHGDGPFPATYLATMGPCDSAEAPLSPDHALRIQAAKLTRDGSIVLRIEPPGVGDSEGPPCDEDTPAPDLRDVARGYLQSLPYVDAKRISVPEE